MRLLILASLLLTAISSHAETRGDRVQAKLLQSPDAEWWEIMDTGPFISDTFREFGGGEVAVLKGIAIKLGKNEDHTIVFDTETTRMVAGFRGNVALSGTPWDGRHGGNSSMPAERSDYFFTTGWGPGWAIAGNWTDPRELDNGIANGPMPDELAEYVGLYRHEEFTVLSYTAGGTDILEIPRLIDGQLVRSLKFSEVLQPLQLLVSDPMPEGLGSGESAEVKISLSGIDSAVLKTLESGRQVVEIPSGESGQLHIVFHRGDGKAPQLEDLDFRYLPKGR
ncbi:MAG: DUF6797 domain-containing protein [Verrucomicrobiota bacterium]